LPATSIFGKEEGENRPLQAYARWLVAQSVDPSMVVTRMKFDTKAEAPKLHFKAMRWLTDDEFTQAGEQGKTDDATKAVTMSVGSTDNAKPADALQGDKPKAKPMGEMMDEDEEAAIAAERAKTTKTKAKAKPAPAPVVEEDEDEAEPEVRKAEKKPSAVAAKKSLADVVGGWDDED
jgi:outer membrane biosynthesis protein TonB